MQAQLKLDSCFDLNDGNRIPVLGLGVFRTPSGEITRNAVRTALEYGYRHIDTARVYCNEKSVGRAIKDTMIPREQIFITTKLWKSDWENPREGLMKSLERLQTDYIDLYLLHWPFKGFEKAYLELEKLKAEGLIKSIGVSNFKIHHLKELKNAGATICPAVNQVECHPANSESELLEYCTKKGIVLTAYSPLGGQGRTLVNDPRIIGLADYYKVTPAQLILRWNLQRGVVVIPKSVHPERILENSGLFNFEISKDDQDSIDSINTNEKRAFDSDRIDFRPQESFPVLTEEE